MPAKLHVLLIDDDIISRELISMMLEVNGVEVSTAEDGEDALTSLQQTNANGATASPDILVMDAQLPGISGIDLISQLRQLTAAPIFAISGSDPGPALRQAADGFLLKPIDPESLAESLAKFFPNPTAPSDVPQDSPAWPQPCNPSADFDSTSEKDWLIDPVVLNKLRALMPPSALTEIYAAVDSDLDIRLPALTAAVEHSDLAEVHRIAHAIKGGCSMAGLSSAAAAASRLESSNIPHDWPKELFLLHNAHNALKKLLQDRLPW